MKQTKLLCLFMGILLSFTACQEDDIEFTREKSGTVTSRLINYEELKAMPKAMAELQKIKEEKLKKSVYNERYDFTVDTTEVLLIEIGDYHSLTFSIIRDSTYDDTVENLVLNWEPYADYLAFKAEYNLTEEEKDKIRNNEHVDLTNKERLTILFNFEPETVLKFNGGGNEEQIVYINGQCYRGGWVRVRSFSNIPGQLETSEWRWVYQPVPCPEGNADHSWTEGNNPGGSGGTQIPVFNTPYPTPNPPIGDNTLPGGSPSPYNPIITKPKPKPVLFDPDRDQRQENCENLNNRYSDPTFIAKLQELKSKAASQNFESAYVSYKHPDGSITYSQEFTGNPNGAAGGKEIQLKIPTSGSQTPVNSIEFIHCHLDDNTTFKIFSLNDLYSFCILANMSTNPTKDLGLYVVTSSGTFALKVKNRIQFKAKLINFDLYIKNLIKDYESMIKITQNIDDQVKGLLSFLSTSFGETDSGLDLYKLDEVNSTWSRLEINGIKVVKSRNCN